MDKYIYIGDERGGKSFSIPDECEFKVRLVNCQNRSDCEYYMEGEGNVVCPLKVIRAGISIMSPREEG